MPMSARATPCPPAASNVPLATPRPSITGGAHSGAALLLTFMMMLMLSGLAMAVGVSAHNSLMTGRTALEDRQAYYIAEAGWQRARQALSAGTWQGASGSGNTYTESFGEGEYAVTIIDNTSPTVTSGDTDYTILSQGYIPAQANYRARRQIHEYELDVTVSNTNYSLTATASASSVNGSNVAANAKDDDDGTHWKSDVNGSGSWLQMDYGSAVALDQIFVEEESNVTGISAVEYSDNGSTWTAVSDLAITEDGKDWTCDFTSTSHRYMRVTFTASSSKKVEVDEMHSYNTAAGTATITDDGEVTTEW
jgi:hypothetical protein